MFLPIALFVIMAIGFGLTNEPGVVDILRNLGTRYLGERLFSVMDNQLTLCGVGGLITAIWITLDSEKGTALHVFGAILFVLAWLFFVMGLRRSKIFDVANHGRPKEAISALLIGLVLLLIFFMLPNKTKIIVAAKGDRTPPSPQPPLPAQPKTEPSSPAAPLKVDFVINHLALVSVVNNGRSIDGLYINLGDCTLDHTAYSLGSVKIAGCNFNNFVVARVSRLNRGERKQFDVKKMPFVVMRDIDRSTCVPNRSGGMFCATPSNEDEHWYVLRFVFIDSFTSETREHYDIISADLFTTQWFGHIGFYSGTSGPPSRHGRDWKNDIPILIKQNARDWFGT